MDYKVSEKNTNAVNEVLSNEKTREAMQFIEKEHKLCIDDQIRLTLIEAPTFEEAERAEALKKDFENVGLTDVHIDKGGNVVGTLKGNSGKGRVLVEGHLDTVFPKGTVKEVTEKDGVLYAPGIGDDTRALAMMLSMARAFKSTGIKTDKDVVFVGTTREEGMGSLGGMKDFLDDNDDIVASISIDGDSIGTITFEATGFKTYEITFYGIGGHAYGAFGKMANPLHAAARAVAKISDFEVPSDPKTTFCVSNFHAGNKAGAHAIVPSATIMVNFRSNSQEIVEELNERIFNAVKEACEEETTRWGKDTITYDCIKHCEVPAGTQDIHSNIVECVYNVIESFGIKPDFRQGGSTNANIAIAKKIPAICIGRAYYPNEVWSTKVHNLEECFPTEGAYKGVQEAFIMTLLCAGITGEIKSIID